MHSWRGFMRSSLMTIPVEVVYLPVKSDARYAAQTGVAEVACRKLTPPAASASMFGVRARTSPA
jgi:hypothetical protein